MNSQAYAYTYIDDYGQLIFKCFIPVTLPCDIKSDNHNLSSVSSEFTCEYKPSGKRQYFHELDDMPVNKQSKFDDEDLDF